ncbi:MAG: hypothetical protein IJ393_07490, partial [Clostridia bacterium]|nr:hypothetical protein [Clostridia bacterium]
MLASYREAVNTRKRAKDSPKKSKLCLRSTAKRSNTHKRAKKETLIRRNKYDKICKKSIDSDYGVYVWLGLKRLRNG